MAAEAAVREAAKLLEDVAHEARDTQSRHVAATEVLAQMAEALFDATHNLAAEIQDEVLRA